MKYVVGLPDTQGGMCWLAGYESDPTRYYNATCALRFDSTTDAECAIVEAMMTHPGRERTYKIIPESEMEKYELRYTGGIEPPEVAQKAWEGVEPDAWLENLRGTGEEKA